MKITAIGSGKSPDFNTIKASLRQPVIFDDRNLFKPSSLVAMGIEYHGFGRENLV